MPAAILDLKSTEDVRDVVHQLVQALAEGQLVAFPTETVYGIAASALSETAVKRLVDVKGRDSNNPLTLAVKSSDDALDFFPDMSPLGERLARRCWPGPLTLVMDDSHPDSVIHRLPKFVQDWVVKDGSVGIRVPAHEVLLETMRLLAGPLTLSSANRSGEPPGVNAQQVAEALGNDLAVIVDDGDCQFSLPSTVVKIKEESYEILRKGVLDEAAIEQLSGLLILIVCTGNTCRSPMGELLMKARIAEHLSVPLEDLQDRGINVMSAGVAAIPGSRVSHESVVALHQRGLDLSGHASQPVTPRLVRHADLILTMTHGHRNALVQEWPEVASRTFTLSQDRVDISDPIGGPQALYERCAEQIDQEVRGWLPKLPLPKSKSE